MVFLIKIHLKYLENSSKLHPKSPPMAPWDPLWTTSQSWDPSWTFFHNILEPFWSTMGSLGALKIEEKSKKHLQKTRLESIPQKTSKLYDFWNPPNPLDRAGTRARAQFSHVQYIPQKSPK